ncbi:hypothetical protein SSBR45G_28860 [Bradyrhizobium sp. SSBR45G]|uniref:serine hydrolase domain-containing protein n=1 Tax=unclassified Bradyrhizobium TaxID=2631580 RepID=UPI002342A146|nr:MULTISPECIES: serine hydrolase [unclassified Bradyrhizobium]GLH77978.1 hypothetical protein SSBR45G_28860 [Bradyrhizobium sp. SSBR45G]GLH85400.1 hypothetical protein SSBR45R_28600 [Bradyrhizobium sp. SSBR45R]
MARAVCFAATRPSPTSFSALAGLPLAHQPGEVWDYGLSVDVLARVVEVVSAQPFDQFLEERLFRPLGMVDTGFSVPPSKLSRLVDPPSGGWGGPPDSISADVAKPTVLFSGGGGLASTAADYLRFCQMLLNGGALDGVRILEPVTVRRMTANALPPQVRFAGINSGIVGPLSGSTWGLGFAIRSDPKMSVVPGSLGSFMWMGAGGTYFWIDPEQQLIAIQLVQVASGTGASFNAGFRNLAYGALRIPDQGVPVPVTIDRTALEAFVGTYRFASVSSRDLQTEFGASAFR